MFAATYTKLPDNVSDTVRQTALEATEGARVPTPQHWRCRGSSGSAPVRLRHVAAPTTNDPLTNFLTIRRGFCQQFAGAFAVMARSLQLPTRVVVGFVPGDRQADGSWSVSWHDTHAWPEVYFEGAGWTRFEPTPSDGNAGITDPAVHRAAAGPTRRRAAGVSESANPGGPSSSASGSLSPGGIAPDEERDRDSASALAAQGNGFPWVWVLVPLAVDRRAAAALGGAQPPAPGGASRRTTSPDPREAAAAAWTELSATCADLDLAWPASRTPRQVALHLIEAARLEPSRARGQPPRASTTRSPGSPAADALRRLALTTERARYARTTDVVRGLADDVMVARAGLLASVDRKTAAASAARPDLLAQQRGLTHGRHPRLGRCRTATRHPGATPPPRRGPSDPAHAEGVDRRNLRLPSQILHVSAHADLVAAAGDQLR